jgi:hypothetical protein
MLRTRRPLVLVALVVIAIMTLAATAAASGNRVTLRADMTGAQEVPAADPDGRGVARVNLKMHTGEVCFDLRWWRIGTPNRAHIHVGAAGVNGGIVVGLFDLVAPPAPPTDPLFDQLEKGQIHDCVPVAAEVLEAIAANPAGYYVNVHNNRFPGGAIRGQLELR